MSRLAGTILFALLIAGCGSDKPPAAAPIETKEACQAAGGRLATDIGDGSGGCAPGEEMIGKVKGTIEGGFCCRAAAQKTP
jgi:hypothetical protein